MMRYYLNLQFRGQRVNVVYCGKKPAINKQAQWGQHNVTCYRIWREQVTVFFRRFRETVWTATEASVVASGVEIAVNLFERAVGEDVTFLTSEASRRRWTP